MARNCTLCGLSGHNQRTCSEKGKSIKLFGVKISTTTSKKDSANNYGRKIKKAIPWTEEEHRLFLKGLEIYGKSNWAKISKDLLPNRTHIQIASHAQKYFMRLTAASNERKNRKKTSIFDVHLEEMISEEETSNVSEHTIQEHAQETGGNIPTSQVPCERAIVPLEIIKEHAQDHQETTAISSERNHSYNFFIIPCFMPVLNLPVFHSFAIN
ncbi:PREDICTED: transcription factor MYB1R1-like [Nicotiana attenuata]|uniref:Transcription factor myb1r1 n=1 Tax=Nicotiana attenuata TaxID=49451 RepID=A0A1J6KKK0_NICAT|nr:PREDICTED: transcription factor MYB1R1-like [Nicotiana attenuata]OIT25392.1 transcription factor myb1r1 [Nicotiana attenuata]